MDTTHITLHQSKEKRHQHLREGLKHTRQILAKDMPRVILAMKAFFKGTERRGEMRARRWAMTAKEDETKWTASTNTEWLQAALKDIGHSLRHASVGHPTAYEKGQHQQPTPSRSRSTISAMPGAGLRAPQSWRQSTSTSLCLAPKPLTSSSGT